MDFTKATNDQLWTILKNDNGCPSELMKAVVEETLNRGRFDPLIKFIIRRMFPFLRDFLYKMNMSKEDLIQYGRIGVLNAQRNYRPSKQSFFTFAYMNIKSEFGHLLEKSNTHMRKHYGKTESTHKEIEENLTLGDTIQDTFVLEDETLNKVEWQHYMSMMDDREKLILDLFVQGYTFNEMAKGMVDGLTSPAGITKVFHKSTRKINPDLEKNVNIKELSLYTTARNKHRRVSHEPKQAV